MAVSGTTVAVIIGAVVAAAAAGYGAYAANEAQQDAARQQKNAFRMQAEAEEAAGLARRKQVEYDTKRKQKSMLSRQAAAGVVISEGSLLESEMEFAADADYAAQLAQSPYQVASDASEYRARLFGYSANRLASQQGIGTGVASTSALAASGSTLATRYGRTTEFHT